MLLAVFTSVKTWAQDDPDDGLTLLTGPDYFTATDGTDRHEGEGHEGEDYVCLLDGKYTSDNHSKWFVGGNGFYATPEGSAFIEFHTPHPVVPKKYVLIKSDDTWSYFNGAGNPRVWKILAKRNEGDAWTEIANVTSGSISFTDYAPTTFDFNNNNDNPYQYFRFEITGVWGWGNVSNSYYMELEELQIKIKNCAVPIDAIEPTCTEDGRIECWYKYSTRIWQCLYPPVPRLHRQGRKCRCSYPPQHTF